MWDANIWTTGQVCHLQSQVGGDVGEKMQVGKVKIEAKKKSQTTVWQTRVDTKGKKY